MFLRRTPECCWHIAVQWTTSTDHEREMKRHQRARCTMDLQPSTTNARGANKCSPAVLHANRLQVLGRSRHADGTRIPLEVRSTQLQPKGSHRRRSLANVERFRKDDAQLLEFWAVAVDQVDDGLTRVKIQVLQNHFHQNPVSSKTSFIKNQFYQKTVSFKTVSSKSNFIHVDTFIKNHFHQKPFSPQIKLRVGTEPNTIGMAKTLCSVFL